LVNVGGTGDLDVNSVGLWQATNNNNRGLVSAPASGEGEFVAAECHARLQLKLAEVGAANKFECGCVRAAISGASMICNEGKETLVGKNIGNLGTLGQRNNDDGIFNSILRDNRSRRILNEDVERSEVAILVLVCGGGEIVAIPSAWRTTIRANPTLVAFTVWTISISLADTVARARVGAGRAS